MMLTAWQLGTHLLKRAIYTFPVPATPGKLVRLDLHVRASDCPDALAPERLANLALKDATGQMLVSVNADAIGGLVRDGIITLRFAPGLFNSNVAFAYRIEVVVRREAEPIDLSGAIFTNPEPWEVP